MAHNAVQIERLHLRIPGLSREEAQRTGEESPHGLRDRCRRMERSSGWERSICA